MEKCFGCYPKLVDKGINELNNHIDDSPDYVLGILGNLHKLLEHKYLLMSDNEPCHFALLGLVYAIQVVLCEPKFHSKNRASVRNVGNGNGWPLLLSGKTQSLSSMRVQAEWDSRRAGLYSRCGGLTCPGFGAWRE